MMRKGMMPITELLKFEVDVVRMAPQVMTIEVEAISAPAANERALKEAPNRDFTGLETDADYHVDACRLKSTPSIVRQSLAVSERKAMLVAAFIIECSQWFEIEPMPDGFYDIFVKKDFYCRLVNFYDSIS